jgi:hypothetical protein
MTNPTSPTSTFRYDVAELNELSAAERAQVRAIEDGRNARSTSHLGQYAVAPQVNRGYSYLCTVLGPSIGAPVRVTCNCSAGQHRAHLDVPCRHAGRVIERLRAEGLVTWSESLRQAVYTEHAVRTAIVRLQADLESFESFRASALAESVFG